MYIEAVANRNSPPAVLLRESYREDGKVRKRTLANLSCLSGDVIEGLKLLLRGGVAVTSAAGLSSASSAACRTATLPQCWAARAALAPWSAPARCPRPCYSLEPACREESLIPDFHAAIDERFSDAHFDPQNFSLDAFASAVHAHRKKLGDKTSNASK